MNRRDALSALIALGLAVPGRGHAQSRLPILGILTGHYRLTQDEIARDPAVARFKALGWIEGQTLTIDRVYGEGSEERLSELAAKLVRTGVDVIWTLGPEAAVAAATATKTIPIVFWGVAWPIELGLVDSLARPGRNVTGVGYITAPEVYGKLVEFLRQLSPTAKRLALITVPQAFRTVSGHEISGARGPVDAAAKLFGFEIRHYPIARGTDLDAAFRAILDARTDALCVPATALTWRERSRITQFANQSRLLHVYTAKDFVDAAGLLSYGLRGGDTYIRSFEYVDRILRGAKPADLPVELPSQIELAINLKTARTLGVTIPPSLLARADQVIE